jgi:homoserine dehydrogenase
MDKRVDMREVDVLLHGFGNVNRRVLELLERQRALLAARHEMVVRVVGAVDSRGGVFAAEGIKPVALLAARDDNGTVAAAPGGEEGLTALECLARAKAPLTLLEATPVDLETGGAGLAAAREALRRGHSVVSANKGPLVLAFAELEALAREQGVGLMYSATVCGGLPAVNMGRYDLAHASILRLQGIVNSTTNFILMEMGDGGSFEEALQEAQQLGVAETDPSLDVSGQDAANKLIILANSVLRFPAGRDDVEVEGIEGIDVEAIRGAADEGKVIKLVAEARLDHGRYRLTVGPRRLPLVHPLAGLNGHQMGLWLETDINGEIFIRINEEEPTPTAAAMVRDLVLLARGARAW